MDVGLGDQRRAAPGRWAVGCRVCRARKVKCDGRPGGCHNCERLQLDCLGGGGGGGGGGAGGGAGGGGRGGGGRGGVGGAGVEGGRGKMRTYRSCQGCRVSKTKCSGGRPGCARCAAKGLACRYDGGAAPRWTSSLARAAGPPSPGPRPRPGGGSGDGNGGDDDERSGPRPPSPAVSPPTTTMTTPMTTAADWTRGAPAAADDDDGPGHSLAWLLSAELPTGRNLRRVVEQYFANVHPLRCFGFVHKPSFMRQMDGGGLVGAEDESALLHVVCAHGARFLVLERRGRGGEPEADAAVAAGAGGPWAARAEQLLLADLGRISVQRLMTAILLHELRFRLGQYGQALMLSGLAVRMAQALRINGESSCDVLCVGSGSGSGSEAGSEAAPSVATRESRRRLMWACYVLDAWAGSGGADQLTLLREGDIKIQLPCNERNFGLRIAAVTETLAVGHVLQFLPPAAVPRRPAANMGIMAYYIRLVALWKRVVRYVSHAAPLPPGAPPPWQPDSPFAALDADLRLWRDELPDFVEYSTETIYARLDSNQYGALVLVHCTYHHTCLELRKLAMPDLFFRGAAGAAGAGAGAGGGGAGEAEPVVFPPDQRGFVRAAQAACFHHARRIAAILADAAAHGPRFLADSLLPFVLYDSSRVMLYYVARLVDPARADADATRREAVAAVEGNDRVLRLMATLFPVAQSLSATVQRWLFKLQQTASRDELVSSLQSEHRLGAHRSDMFRGGARASPGGAASPGAASAGWSTVNPNAGGGGGPAPWDGTSSLPPAGLSGGLDAATRPPPGLQHEQPVPPPPPPPSLPPPALALPLAPQPPPPPCEGLDLDDLQSFLSWDMHGIMAMGGGVSNDDLDDAVSQSWTGAI